MKQKKRPFLYKLIIFSLAIIAILGWLRVYQSLYQWTYLLELGVTPGPWYSMITGIIIGIIATVGVVIGWFRWRWSEVYIQVILVAVSIGWWVDYLAFSKSSIAFYNLPFRVVLNVLFLIFVIGYFYLLKKKELRGER